MGNVKPYLFSLDHDGQDLHFRRVQPGAPRLPSEWGLHADLDYPAPDAPWNVLIFVRVDTPANQIMDGINKAQTYWRQQTEAEPRSADHSAR